MFDWVLPGVVLLFVITQSLYFVTNVLFYAFYLVRTPTYVDEDTTLDDHPPVHILIPVYKERREILAATIDGIFDAEYPADKLTIHLIHEPDDAQLMSYVVDFAAEHQDRDIELATIPVNRYSDLWEQVTDEWRQTRNLPKTKACALEYALRKVEFDSDDIITVFDSDTRVPADTIPLGVAGLTTFDIVQAKQTVRNLDDGWLPRNEAMGIAAWSDIVYARTTSGPYQLLGKAYFMTAETLYELSGWDVNAITEDMKLGFDAYQQGYTLGVIDRYIQDLCPATFTNWLTQKRRWARGPYPLLGHDALSWRERLQFTVYTLVNQLLSVVNPLGIIAGVGYTSLVLLGAAPSLHPGVQAIVAVNAVAWAYYSLRSYMATADAVDFADRSRIVYFLRVNPVTQVVYATLWAVPIALAFWDWVRGVDAEFEVTEK